MKALLSMLLTASAPAACALAVAGCGSSSGNANKLLQETFTGRHRIASGLLDVELTIDPGHSTTLRGPITLSFGGPFESLGSGRLPQSSFSLGLGGPGFGGSIGIVSTGSSGFVTLKGVGYQLPQASYQRLESSFAAAAGPSAGGILSHLDTALTSPRVVGQEDIGGAETTHIRAGVDVAAVLSDLSTILRRASSLGVSRASGLSTGLTPAVRTRVAAEVVDPTFDLWTGLHDETLRRLQIGATLPVSGPFGQLLGSASARVWLSIQYSQLNAPQTIAAPGTVRPFTEFVTKLRGLEQSLEGAIVAGQLPGAGTSAANSSAPSTTAASSAAVLRYSKCIEAAGNDVAKMQKCAPLLGTGS